MKRPEIGPDLRGAHPEIGIRIYVPADPEFGVSLVRRLGAKTHARTSVGRLLYDGRTHQESSLLIKSRVGGQAKPPLLLKANVETQESIDRKREPL